MEILHKWNFNKIYTIMKKQNVNKLAFNKAVIAELNSNDLTQINGGAISSTGQLCDVISIIIHTMTKPILL